MRSRPEQISDALELLQEARERRADGNLLAAGGRYKRAVAIAAELGEVRWEAELLAEAAAMRQEAYEVDEAKRLFEQALLRFEALADPAEIGLTLFRLGQIEQLSGAVGEAESRFRASLGYLDALPDARAAGLTRAALGQLLWSAGDPDAGVPNMVRGLASLRSAGAPEAEHVREHIRYWRSRLSRPQYRELVEAATPDDQLRSALLD
jgi:tetratricopeptide (TPR) repeat protein